MKNIDQQLINQALEFLHACFTYNDLEASIAPNTQASIWGGEPYAIHITPNSSLKLPPQFADMADILGNQLEDSGIPKEQYQNPGDATDERRISEQDPFIIEISAEQLVALASRSYG